MRAIVVGGAGAMGRIVAMDLARSSGVEAVTVADLDEAGAAAVAERARALGSADVRATKVNLTSPAFAEALRGHDVAIASVAYRFNPVVAEACLEAGCHYVDLGGLFHVARTVLAMNDRFRDAGLTGVTCMGGAPGLTNMLAAKAARELDVVTGVHVRLAATDPSTEDVPLPIPYSLETLLDEFSQPAQAYHDGEWVEVEPLGEPEEMEFPEPFGRRTALTTIHSEVATLPLSFPTAREVTFKLAFDQDFIDRFRLVSALGLASTEPMAVRGVEVKPRDVLLALASRLPQPDGVDDLDFLRVVVEGERDGRPATVVAELLVEPDRELGVGGGARDTGVPPSLVAQMIAAGEVKGPGMFPPEQAVEVDRFFERLAERSFAVALKND